MNFIKLTNCYGAKIRVNFDLIESYGTINENAYSEYSGKFEGLTFLCYPTMGNDQAPYIVKETPKQIDELIKPRKVKENGN